MRAFVDRPRWSIRAAARCGRLSLVLLACAAVRLAAQEGGAPDTAPAGPDTASGPRSVAGRIVRPGTHGLTPMPGLRVTLHRVGSDTAGPIDSTRSGRDGGYAFSYRRTGSADAVYFVSAWYRGIAYFSLPLTRAHIGGADGEITVFDTTSGPIPLTVRGRHIVISSPTEDGTRQVMEVYELSNDSSLTLVSPDDAHPVWSALLPGQETGFAAGQGDLSVRAVRESRGRVAIVAPFAPGLKQVSFTYTLPGSAFPLSLPMDHAAAVLEVLLEEPSGRVTGGSLVPVAPASIEGRTFVRFLAQDVEPNTVIRIAIPQAALPRADRRLLVGIAIAIAALMLAALAVFLARARARPAAVVPVIDASERLAREIARLDVEFAREDAPAAGARERYESRRAALKRELVALLDARGGAR